jgi:hypothetical protein
MTPTNALALLIIWSLAIVGAIFMVQSIVSWTADNRARKLLRRMRYPKQPLPPAELPWWKAVGMGAGICVIATLVLLPFFPH